MPSCLAATSCCRGHLTASSRKRKLLHNNFWKVYWIVHLSSLYKAVFYFNLWLPAIIFAQNQSIQMSQKIKPTGKQKQIFMIHAVVFAIATVIMWMTYNRGATGWVYPWPAWITAAWGLSLIGHWCAVYTSVEDKGMDDYMRQSHNG